MGLLGTKRTGRNLGGSRGSRSVNSGSVAKFFKNTIRSIADAKVTTICCTYLKLCDRTNRCRTPTLRIYAAILTVGL